MDAHAKERAENPMGSLNRLLEKEPVEASAPCRIDMGGTLDLSTFYLPLRHLGPCTFNAALNLRTRVIISPHADGRLKVSSTGFQDLEVESAMAPFDHPLGLMTAVAAYFGADGVHIRIDSGSPPRSALGGSSVAAVALIWAFAKLMAREGHPLPEPRAVAMLAHAIEQSVAGVPCGIQDQLAAVYGGINGWYWSGPIDGPVFERKPIAAFKDPRVFSRHLLVAYCGVTHVSGDINGTWVREFLAGRHRGLWERIVSLSRQFIQALSRGDLPAAQACMNEETDLRCRMTPEVLDGIGRQLVEAARQARCAARFTGAGGGGCLWALGKPPRIQALRPVWRRILSQRGQARILEAAVDPTGLL
jgi:D-glycero-alpha-D-manno-heptose-7-phosphate kinase